MSWENMYNEVLNEQNKICDKLKERDKELGTDSILICNILSGQTNMKFYDAAQAIASYLIKRPKKDRELLIRYRILTNLMKDPYMPTKPYYGRCAEDMYLIDENELENSVDNLIVQWDKQRENKYWGANSVIYDRDYSEDWLKCGKYPIVAGQKLGEFYQKVESQLMRHTETGNVELSQLTFIEPMFAVSQNGKLYRFALVVELIPITKKVGPMQKPVSTYEFSISVKLIPDDDLQHSSCVYRFDSKDKAHTNIIGRKGKKENPYEQYALFERERVYLQDSSSETHMHTYDRFDQVSYVLRPLGSNSVTITQVLNIIRKDWRDDSAFSLLIRSMIHEPKIKNMLLKIRETLKQSETLLEKGLKRQAWLVQFDAMRQAVSFVKEVFNIGPELRLEEATSRINGHGTTDIRRMIKEYNKLNPPKTDISNPEEEESEKE